jgi:hypothetical protein
VTLDDRIGVFDQLGRILEKYLESSTSQEEPVSESGYSDPDIKSLVHKAKHPDCSFGNK